MGISFTTRLWARSESSFGTTVPKEILAIKGADPGDETIDAEWSINENTGAVEVSFVEVEDED